MNNYDPSIYRIRGKKLTVTQYICDLLCEVVYYEDKTKPPDPKKNRVTNRNPNRRSVGLTYVDIVKQVKTKFPDAKVTTTSLRRIAHQIQTGEIGHDLMLLPQRRPRSKTK